ncbi:MAG: hypothetical protein GXO83_04600 [Chlorobi bacterium]|nr:hypothetical protein [Chlorobiota bacterium]
MNPINLQVVLHALGWTLIHAVWQLFILGMLVWLLRKMAGNRQPVWQYRITLLFMISAVVVSVLTFAAMLEISSTLKTGNIPVLPGINPFSDFRVQKTQASVLAGLFSLLDRWSVKIIFFWSLGVAFFGMKNLLSLWRIRMIRKYAIPADQQWVQCLGELARKVGLKRNLGIMVHPGIRIPFVTGIFKPVILVPLSLLTGYTTGQIEAILIHELEHIRRFDLLARQVTLWIRTIYFYHPVIWWMDRLLENDRELCCDQVVVSHTGAPFVYARTLMKMSYHTGKLPVREVALMNRKNKLFHRIEWIMEKMNQHPQRRPMGLIILAALLLSVWFTVQGRAGLKPESAPGPEKMNVIQDHNGLNEQSLFENSTIDAVPFNRQITSDQPQQSVKMRPVTAERKPQAHKKNNQVVEIMQSDTKEKEFNASGSENDRKIISRVPPAGLSGKIVRTEPYVFLAQQRYFIALQDTLKKHPPGIDAMTWEEMRRAQIESMQNLQEALRLAQDSLRVFNRESAEVIRREMEKARQAYMETLEHFRSEEFRQEMENMKEHIETYRFPADSLREAMRKQMEAIRRIDWDSIYRQMEKARIEMGKNFRNRNKGSHEAMDAWQKEMEQAMKHHEEALKKQEEILEQLEKEDQQQQEKKESGKKKKKTKL